VPLLHTVPNSSSALTRIIIETIQPVGKDFTSWIEERSSSTETLIIGGGLAGTATAFSLSEKGIKSCLVEQGSSVAPSTASSNGDSRMYRKMYSVSVLDYVSLCTLSQLTPPLHCHA